MLNTSLCPLVNCQLNGSMWSSFYAITTKWPTLIWVRWTRREGILYYHQYSRHNIFLKRTQTSGHWTADIEQPTCSISLIAVQMHWRFFPHEIWLFNQRRILRFKKCRLRMLRCNPCMPLLQVFFKIYSHLNSTIENREDWAQRISLKHTILMSSIGRVHARW